MKIYNLQQVSKKKRSKLIRCLSFSIKKKIKSRNTTLVFDHTNNLNLLTFNLLTHRLPFQSFLYLNLSNLRRDLNQNGWVVFFLLDVMIYVEILFLFFFVDLFFLLLQILIEIVTTNLSQWKSLDSLLILIFDELFFDECQNTYGV